MALRSRSRTAIATSGPGRGPVSDGRTRHRRHHARGRGGRHQTSAEVLRRRAEALFAERAGEPGGSGVGPSVGSDGPPADSEVRPSVDSDGLLVGSELGPPGGWAGEVRGSEGRRGGASRRGDVSAGPGAGAGAGGGAYEGAVAGVGSGTGADIGGVPGAWRERVGPAVRERLPLWLQSRCGLERRSVAALTVVLVVAAVFAAQHFWTGRTQQVRAPEVVRAAVPYGEESGREGTKPESSTGAPTPGGGPGSAIFVDVSGKVRSPGVQRLPAGSRVADALRAAGGVRPGTKTEGLNRARLLVDGEQVVVGGPAPPAGVGSGQAGTSGGAGSVTGSVPGGPPAAPVSLNAATAEQLDTLPGVGPVLAQHIIDYRAQHGGFRSVDELREVNGIGDRRFADLRNLVRP
ncbi:ComEA family DNA-binding protein [Streptomyces sp. NPDC004082]|uniref:ComEA family DNA-binding protein n=1 Tax=Streptomyces sp. NPDC005481 TaxID=3154881 RepID=UPI0033B6F3D8